VNVDLILTFAFALAVVWIIFRRPHRFSRRERNELEREDRERAEAESELLDQLARLEERVKVLERIVTEDPNDLRRQFRDLGG